MDDRMVDMAALISNKVARGESPILYAARSKPVDKADSGWQFTAGGSEESHHEQPELWSISEILELDPSLRKYINLDIGTKLIRLSIFDNWVII